MIHSSKSGAYNNRKILIVEDEKPLRDVYSIILEREGYSVVAAPNGSVAIDQLALNTPDIILLDIFMPVLNGIEFLKHINLKNYPNMRVIVFSNNSDSDLKEQVSGLGAHKVVLKSEVSPSSLLQLVSNQLDLLLWK